MNVLFLTHEPLTASIAGPSIRVWELAHLLARKHRVTIGTPNQHPRQSPELEVRCFTGGALPELLQRHEVTVAFGYLLRDYPIIRKLARYLVMDIYGPFVLENLQMYEELSVLDRLAIHQRGIDVVLEQLEVADFFICASERQRDYWLGALSIANRVNPYTSAGDPTLRSLIDVVPFGLSPEPPRVNAGAIKGVVPGIDKNDFVVLWTGGVWDWFDPLTAIEAVARLRDQLPSLKLYFMGVHHPNPSNPRMLAARRAEELAGELGVLNRSVFLNDQWVPYDERARYLRDADLAISLHHQHVETRFSFRTRFLDCLWAGLPILATGGDVLSEAAVAAGAAVSVPESDVGAVVVALRQLASDPERVATMRQRSAALAATYTWDRVAKPLLDYCDHPWRAADRDQPGLDRPGFQRPNALALVRAAYRLDGMAGVRRRARRQLVRSAAPIRGRLARGGRLLRRSLEVFFEGGPAAVIDKARRRGAGDQRQP